MELIFLHGAAASGKLTTARALETLLGYPVFHNHLVVDALTTVFPFGSEPFVRLREEFWMHVFTDAARLDRSVTFTFTFAPEATVPRGFPASARARVEAFGGRVDFVRLLVSETEQDSWIGNPDRKQINKLSGLNSLRRLRNDHEIIEQPPTDLEVNTDTTSAEESAALITGRFHLRAQERKQRYPEPE